MVRQLHFEIIQSAQWFPQCIDNWEASHRDGLQGRHHLHFRWFHTAQDGTDRLQVAAHRLSKA